MVSGDVQSELEAPFTLALSRKVAAKYFPNRDALGQTVNLNGHVFRVVAVFEDIPVNSHLTFDWVTSVTTYLKTRNLSDREQQWSNWAFYTYLLLEEGTDAEGFLVKLRQMYNEKVPTRFQMDNVEGLFIQPLRDIHFENRTVFEVGPHVERQRLWLFGAVALAILLIACFNYINLATARTSLRAKEIGLRKVVGAKQRQLIHQFMAEASLTLLLSLGVAVVLFSILIAPFSHYVGHDLSSYLSSNPPGLGCSLAGFLLSREVWLGFIPLCPWRGSGPYRFFGKRPSAAINARFGFVMPWSSSSL